MRHFIAYHNTEKMGFAVSDTRVLTNKSVKRLADSTVWLIAGEGIPRRYCLATVFHADKVGAALERGFKWCASGAGHVFAPPLPVGDEDWFRELLHTARNFSLGLTEIKSSVVISELQALAAQAGYDLSLPHSSQQKA